MGSASTVRFGLVVLWIVIGGLQYGFHISALNSTQEAIICASPYNRPRTGFFGTPTCVELTDFGFGVVTASFTLGGFFSSVISGGLADKVGRKMAAVYGAWLIVAGTLAMSFGSVMFVLVIGRVLIGLACGLATVLVPLYLSEVAPAAIKGSIGVLMQLSVCVGIFLAQVVSIPLSSLETGNWRYVTLVSCGLAALQILTAPIMVESPVWLAENHPPLFNAQSDEERAPLASNEPDGADDDNASGFLERSSASAQGQESMSLTQVITSSDPAVKRGLLGVIACQWFQQGSGINAVMYYSTGILSTVSPNAKYVTLFVTLMNVGMTFPAIYLVERLGRRPLLQLSLGTMSFASLMLAYSINNSYFLLASVFIVAFVSTFAVGLGPVPFLLLGELPPQRSRSASASAALAVNWSTNFIIGLLFLPLRNWLSGGKTSGEGTIFYGFALISAAGFVVISRLLA
ncbi:general substrate transporter [Meredithblackwellia eburnea MCA 4105]